MAADTTTHNHDGGASTRKKIYMTTLILSVLTAIEFVIAYAMGPGTARLSIFLIMTLIKAFYIVSVFMHLGSEVKRLIWGILIPFGFIVWLLIALSKDGDHYGNNALKDANMKRQAVESTHGSNHGESKIQDTPKTEEANPSGH